MSDVVTLTARGELQASVDLEGITADCIAGLGSREIADLPVWSGRMQLRVGDFFQVSGERAACVRIEGATPRMHGIGAGTTAGEMIVDGDAGSRLAAGMTGGRIRVTGRAGADAGMAMSGGCIVIDGDAGPRVGGAAPGAACGMTGGEIVVRGDAGNDAVALMRRGLVVIVGKAGDDAARDVIAGTLVCLGDVGRRAGRGNKRGSLAVLGAISIPETYALACTFDPPYLRLLLTYLRRTYGVPVDERTIGGLYRRYCGDFGRPGKGEILLWTGR